MSYQSFRYAASKWPVALLLFLSSICYGNIRLPAILASNMVLQQRSEVKLWGWGEPNEKVLVTTSWNNKTYPAVTVTAFADWRLTVPTPAAGGPYTITIAGRNRIVLSNVMVGEVWICGGQSNMEMCGNWGLQDVKAEYARAHFTGLRLFHVAKAAAAEPQDNCVGSWESCDSVSLPAFSAAAYFFGKKLEETLHVPVGLIESCWGGSSAEVWTPDSLIRHDDVLREAATKVLPNGQVPHLPGYTYNAMIAPLTNFCAAGVIWYQGENNTMTAGTYPRLFRTLMDGWRSAWGKDLPFYYVQVAPFRYQRPNIGALMREAQTRCLQYPNTGMVVTTDLVSDIGNVHPSDKHDVGLRLANWALAETYHHPGLTYKSPLYDKMVVDKDKVIVYIDHPGSGLVARGKEVAEIYIAGVDRVFHPAQAVVEKDRLIVRSRDVPHPVAVRYGFSNTAIGNIFNREGLPLGPFRTDDWPVEGEYSLTPAQRPGMPIIAGKFVHIFDPNDTRSDEDTTWYTNDHSFIRGKDGVWHAYGIIGHHPVRPWGGETKFFHITASSLRQEKWEDHGYALATKEGVERVLWAPYVLQDKGLSYMFYNIGTMHKDA
ncbi:MAG TPA: sialate O-acetylesterase, partial [Puia sp.]